MSIPVVAFFSSTGGVGKTTLVYHLAWVLQDLGFRVVAADLDPQANLTGAFLDEDALEILWEPHAPPTTIYGCIQPIMRGLGDIASPAPYPITDGLALLTGDLSLSSFEDKLSSEWPKCLDKDENPFRVVSSFWRILQYAASQHRADVILIDLGPNLGAINRSALIAADYVVVPLSPDLFSLQGLRSLGPTFKKWRTEWAQRLQAAPRLDFPLPAGRMEPLGYVVFQLALRLDRPVRAYRKWMDRIPAEYRTTVLNTEENFDGPVTSDRHNLAMLKHYRSLTPLAQEAHKPIFHLTAADGAIGAHFTAAQEARKHFELLATKILDQTGVRSQH